MGLHLQETLTKNEIETFVTVLFEHRTYGLVIKTLQGDLQADWGDWIIRFPDGTFSVVAGDVWDKYLAGNCKKVKR